MRYIMDRLTPRNWAALGTRSIPSATSTFTSSETTIAGTSSFGFGFSDYNYNDCRYCICETLMCTAHSCDYCSTPTFIWSRGRGGTEGKIVEGKGGRGGR